MSLFRYIIATFLVATLWATPALAEKKYIQGWEIEPSFKNGSFQSCTMFGAFQQGQLFGILVTSDFRWAVSIGDPRWRLDEGAAVAAAIVVDGRYLPLDTAKALSNKSAIIKLANDQAFRALQVGSAMTISVNGRLTTMSLRGTSAAMRELLGCVAINVRNPSDVQTGSLGETKTAPLSDAESLFLVSNLLSRAGITGYELDPPSHGLITWRYADGGQGLFFGFKNFNGSLDKLTSDAVSTISEKCTGDFASAKKATTEDAGSVRKVSMACSHGADIKEYYLNVVQTKEVTAVFVQSGQTAREDGVSPIERRNDGLAAAVITEAR